MSGNPTKVTDTTSNQSGSGSTTNTGTSNLAGFSSATPWMMASPVLGAVADASGRRKPWIALFGTLLGAGIWMNSNDDTVPNLLTHRSVITLWITTGLILALHYEARFLKAPGATERARQGFVRILERYRAPTSAPASTTSRPR